MFTIITDSGEHKEPTEQLAVDKARELEQECRLVMIETPTGAIVNADEIQESIDRLRIITERQ